MADTPRFMTVEEVMRSFGVPSDGPLWYTLQLREGMLSPQQAVNCLGRSIHVGVGRRLVATLRDRGLLTAEVNGPFLRYGSSFSGIDTFAAALDAELRDPWVYVFASESDRVSRRALVETWSHRGLCVTQCYTDVTSEEAVAAPAVDIYVTTPECEAHSRRNHDRNAADQRVSLEAVWDSLAYVRRARPRVVVMENVTEASSVGPITGLLGRLSGYHLETGVLDPRNIAKMPIARERQFWVLTRY